MTGFAAERRKIQQTFANNFTAVSADRIRYSADGVNTFNQPTSGNWVGIQVLSGGQTGRSVGSGTSNVLRRWAGVIQIDIFTPEGEGDDQNRDLADSADAVFPDTTELTVASGHKITPRSRDYSLIGVDGGWVHGVLSINYQRTLIS